MTLIHNLQSAQFCLQEAMAHLAKGQEIPEALLEKMLAFVQATVEHMEAAPQEVSEAVRLELLDLQQGQVELIRWLTMQRDWMMEELQALENSQRVMQSYEATEALIHQA